MIQTPAPVTQDEAWTCFTCDYEGEPGYTGDVAECPGCGTIEGDGFGMKMNDPTHQQPETKR